jgi:transcriptional regulator with XRE-family HTH domain
LNIGEIIRTTRKEKKLTLRELEKISGVSYSLIAKVERGENKPTKETFLKLANALNLDTEDLLNKIEVKATRIPDNNLYRFEVLTRDEFTCQVCGGKAPHVQIDVALVVPLEYNGEFSRDNLITICINCNTGRLEMIKREGLANDILFKRLRAGK